MNSAPVYQNPVTKKRAAYRRHRRITPPARYASPGMRSASHTAEGMSRHAPRRRIRPLLIFGAAYITAWSYLFVATFLGAHPPPAPLFPPAAVLITALLLTPPRRWWIYLAEAFVIQIPILAFLHVPVVWNILGFTPDAIEPVVAVALMLLFI